MVLNRYALITALLFSTVSTAQIPSGYYDSAQGLSGEALQWALHSIIDNHTVVSYSYIWQAFYTTDDRYGNQKYVWDMYSNYQYRLGNDQGGSASREGQGYNREHSWPKSWFNNHAPMNTDLFHIVPTDIYVNNRRSNYPYAEVGTTTWVSQNGSRLGHSSTPGYSGMAFEPIDDYKGDFARNYFYMATRYKGEDTGWTGSAMTDGADLKNWAVDMLMEWHQNDPVSDKELDRNEAVYDIQHNRNPFIDHPEYVQYIYNPQSGVKSDVFRSVFHMTCSPNPFSNTLSIASTVPVSDVSSVTVYDAAGRKVAELSLQAGTGSTATWNTTQAGTGHIEPGIYFVVLSASGGSLSAPVLLVN
jgi:endonuclease I